MSDEVGFMLLLYAEFAIWLCCDSILINLLKRFRDCGELAPLSSQKFQFSLGTLFWIIFGGAAWGTGLVMMLKH